MVEVRWHGRGGQGAKSASQLLAMAQMATGLYVQAFPEYGPERSGAPVRAYNRARSRPIRRHDGVRRPGVVVVLDPTLIGEVDVAGGLDPHGLLIVNTVEGEARIRARTGHAGPLWCVDGEGLAARAGTRYANVVLFGALAVAVGLPASATAAAVTDLMAARLGPQRLAATLAAVSLGRDAARQARRHRAALPAPGRPGAAVPADPGKAAPGFVAFPLPGARVAPDVRHRPRTGSWRSGGRPALDLTRCVGCLLCWGYCPDRAILVHDGQVVGIDDDLCKGCELCVAACPTGALAMVAEGVAGDGGHGGG